MPTQERPDKPKRSQKISKEKPVIVCVDDELVALHALGHELKEKFGDDNYDYQSAASAREALRIIDQHTAGGQPLAMVIADQMMPDMTGAELLNVLGKNFPASVKILLTGQASLESAVDMFNKGDIYRYLIKSWDRKDLLVALEEGLQQYHLLQQEQSQQQFLKNFFPNRFLQYLSKKSTLQVKPGDNVECEMSILLFSIRNVTVIPTGLKSKEKFNFFNHFLNKIIPAVQINGGFIGQFFGETMMALFPASDKALQATFAIQQVVRKLNEVNKGEKYFPFFSSIGLHTGSLMFGVTGTPGQMQTTYISDAISFTEDLRQMTELYGTYIIASKEFLQKINDPVLQTTLQTNARVLGKACEKNKRKKTLLYEIIEPATDPSGQRKLLTKEEFEQGLHAFFDKAFKEACVHFGRVLDKDPLDEVSKFYLAQAAKQLMDNEQRH